MAAPTVKLVLVDESGEEVTGKCEEWEFGHVTDAIRFFDDAAGILAELNGDEEE